MVPASSRATIAVFLIMTLLLLSCSHILCVCQQLVVVSRKRAHHVALIGMPLRSSSKTADLCAEGRTLCAYFRTRLSKRAAHASEKCSQRGRNQPDGVHLVW